ncbi:MAG TPA: HigA family addiction module antitoxin [Allosphingosinicella sp.]|jgi:addiction module HigA family antidote
MTYVPLEPIAVSPGSVLREEIATRLGISQDRLAKALGVSRLTINEIVNEKRNVTAEMALKLAKALGTDPEFWLTLQQGFDLVRARERCGDLPDVEVLRERVEFPGIEGLTERRQAAG